MGRSMVISLTYADTKRVVSRVGKFKCSIDKEGKEQIGEQEMVHTECLVPPPLQASAVISIIRTLAKEEINVIRLRRMTISILVHFAERYDCPLIRTVAQARAAFPLEFVQMHEATLSLYARTHPRVRDVEIMISMHFAIPLFKIQATQGHSLLSLMNEAERWMYRARHSVTTQCCICKVVEHSFDWECDKDRKIIRTPCCNMLAHVPCMGLGRTPFSLWECIKCSVPETPSISQLDIL